MTTADGAQYFQEAEARVQPRPRSPRWEHFIEFLVVGGATFLFIPIGWLLRAVLGLDFAVYYVSFAAFYAAWVINDPHFAVTYLLFYRNVRGRVLGNVLPPLERARYVAVGFVAPVLLAAWAVTALAIRSAPMLGYLIQLMFFLVGWHYVKQGFGVLMVLSARRGFRFLPRERWAFLVHCFAAWAYAWSSPADAGSPVEEHGVVYFTLPHGVLQERVTFVVFLASMFVLGAVICARVLRDRRWPPVLPILAFLVTLWHWTVYSGIDPILAYLIPGLHSLQYLYFVWLMRRGEARAQEGPPLFGKPVRVRLALLALSALGLGWFLFHGAPSVLDEIHTLRGNPSADPEGFGATPYFAALFAFVNLHHYLMDHSLWRRENPDTRYMHAPASA